MVLVFGGHSWLTRTDREERPHVDIDVLRIADEPGRGTTKAKEPTAQVAKPRQTTVATQENVSAATNDATPSAAAESATQEENVTIEGDGRPIQLTTGQYVNWLKSHNQMPKYPRLARMREEQGRGTVNVIVAANGLVENIEMGQSTGSELLDRVCLETVQAWAFPAFAGRPRLQISVPFKFSLTD